MKTRKLILLFAAALMMAATGCKKEDPSAKLESIKFKQATYNISKSYTDFEIKKELETAPAGIADTAKITCKTDNEAVAIVKGGYLIPLAEGTVKLTATIQGKSAECSVIIVDESIVKDCEGHTYRVVKIGSQVWMAENLMCATYDTQSDRNGATLDPSDTYDYHPGYTNATDKTLWIIDEQKHYESGLYDDDIAKLGYLYNWAAAVGLATSAEAQKQKTSFSEPRQGICPNGWHLPTATEWDELATTLGGVKQNDDFKFIGEKLKTEHGWFNNGNGSDDADFSVLPAGAAETNKVFQVGLYAIFQTATPTSAYNSRRFVMAYDNNDLISSKTGYTKQGKHSIRCVKNE